MAHRSGCRRSLALAALRPRPDTLAAYPRRTCRRSKQLLHNADKLKLKNRLVRKKTVGMEPANP